MKYLLDTHVLLWALTGDSRADSVKSEIVSSLNEVYFSSVSIWEIAIKHSIGKLAIAPSKVIEYANRQRLSELVMNSRHAAGVAKLNYPDDIPPHKDPFDNMLISQAKSEGLTLLTADTKIAVYNEPCIRLIQ